MRWNELFEGPYEVSPQLIEWMKTWVESSFKVEDQIEKFDAVRDEAAVTLNVSYPAIYRGLSITDADADKLASRETITIPAHRLQSWTKSRAIAADYALPGYGGDVGVLVRKTGTQVRVVADIENLVRRIGRRNLIRVLGSQDRATDAGREREVVVETPGNLVIRPQDVLKMV